MSLTANGRIDIFRHVGARSFKITGASGVNKSLRQTVKVSGDASSKLTLSGWSYADSPNPAGGINYTYDDNGNMTGDGTRTYLYDAANRLIEVKQGSLLKTVRE